MAKSIYSVSMSNAPTFTSANITNAMASGSAGSVLASNGMGSVGWAAAHTSLQVNGDANFQGDITVKGKSIMDSLNRIEERLAILHPNNDLEQEWDKLRALRNAYMELEAEIKEKQEIWKILKK